MKRTLFLMLTFLSSIVLAQESECVRVKKLSREEILQLPEFKGTSRMAVASFDYKIVNTPSDLKGDGGGYPVITNGYKEIIKLSTDQEYEILDILVNYDFDPKATIISPEDIAACYQPRNALLFYGEFGPVIGYFEVCFSCGSHKFDPTKESLSDFCQGKTDMIKAWMKKVGITYGVNGEVD